MVLPADDPSAAAVADKPVSAATAATRSASAAPPGAVERNLASLFEAELAGTACPATETTGAVQVSRGDGAQWMSRPGRDLFGLALSGGGIRSATFNLGVLQGLNRLGLLECFDYLATVSGGGYIGGFWTAWLKRQADEQARAEAEARGQAGTQTQTRTATGAQTRAWTQSQGPKLPKGESGREPAEIRHLREFSNFLIPRLGLLSYDTGRAVVTVLGSIIPSVLASLSLIALGVLVWALVAWLLFSPAAEKSYGRYPLEGYLLGAALPLGYLLLWAIRRVRAAKQGVGGGGAAAGERRTTFWPIALLGLGWIGITAVGKWNMHAAMMLGGTAAVLVGLEILWQSRGETSPPWAAVAAGLVGLGVTSVVWRLGMTPHLENFYVSGQALPILRDDQASIERLKLFAPAATWAAGAAVFVVLRLLVAPWVARYGNLRCWRAAADRVQSRLLLLMGAWTSVSVLWCAGVLLDHGLADWSGAAGLAGVAATLSAVFARVQHLLGKAKKPGGGVGIRQRLLRYLPRLLAYAVLAIVSVGVVALIVPGGTNRKPWMEVPWKVALAAGAMTAAALVFLDPNEVGLHAFYRGRLARAYLGASNRAGRSRTEEQPDDDFMLNTVCELVRPLHLVCCTANDLAFGDRMSNLSRGAVSGVLSRHGFQVGDCWRGWDAFQRGAPTLASSVTASGAAFNTLMGARSIEYGRAVSFLMATLNLRLGLWLPHPLHAHQARGTWLPGLPFYRELFGRARADGWQVHLSDGGHFENTAVYELIRRHCRVIVATDCGMDPKGAFTDLGNLVRRVRIDFGVEIHIDLSPLHPDEHGRSRQYMVAGDIHYPGGDTGVLLVLKPALVGSEPPDVGQYRARNPAFPHEGTGDQFYTEAQWESYRQLGEHAVVSAFAAVVEPVVDERRPLSAWMTTFARARREWQPKPAGYDARLSHFADRVAELDAVLRQPGCERLLAQVYKEVGELSRNGRRLQEIAAGNDAAPAGGGAAPDAPKTVAGAISDGFRLAVAAIRTAQREQPPTGALPDPDELTHGLYLLRRVLLLMEEVYESEDLAGNSRHPLYLGVMNWFARWAYAPFFRMWWPLLKALYPQPFTRFLESEFALPSVERSPGPQGSVVTTLESGGRGGFAMTSWLQQGSRSRSPDEHVVSFRLEMHYRDGTLDDTAYSIQAAQVMVRAQGHTLWWAACDFFVPPGLWGIGIGNAFLARLMEEAGKGLQLDEVGGVRVRFLAVCVHYCPESKKRSADEMQLYRSAGFCEARLDGGQLWFGPHQVLDLAGVASSGADLQWMVLDLSRSSQQHALLQLKGLGQPAATGA